MKSREPKYVTFDQAKWLKEKDFDINTNTCFHALLGYEIEAPMNWDNGRGYLVRPEQHQVVNWLLEKYSIWVYVESDVYGEYWFPKILPASREVWSNLDLRAKIESITRFANSPYDNPQEAYSAAFDYVLKELI
jgi:hypothetical protein